MDTQRAMADLPELQRRLLERSRLLGFEPYADAPMRVRDRPSSEQDSGSSALWLAGQLVKANVVCTFISCAALSDDAHSWHSED